MKYFLLACLFCFDSMTYASDKVVVSIEELNKAAAAAKAGDRIFLKDGVYKDAAVVFHNNNGRENDSITIGAEHPGKVVFEGNSSIGFSGKYLLIRDFIFQNGGHELKNKQVIEFRSSARETASHCTVTDCVIDGFNNTIKTHVNTWVGLYGEYNMVQRCLFKSKDNMGPTLVVWLEDGKPAHHTIYNNYFLSRLNGAQVDNGLESIRIGDSKTSFTNAHCVIAFNRFEDCDGEIEIISNKSCHNSYYQNTFYNCDGGLTLRHGNYALCDGNYFDGHSKPLSYGIRFIGEGHVAVNNYFTNLHGASHEQYRSPISLLNGLINTPLNGYFQVKSAVIADNIFVDCETPLIRIGAFSRNREGMSLAPDTVAILHNFFNSNFGTHGKIIETITPPLHFSAADNHYSRGYESPNKTGFIEMKESEVHSLPVLQSQRNNDLSANGAGADWVMPSVAQKLQFKYSILLPSAVGPLWKRAALQVFP